MTDTTTPARPARRTTISDLMKVYRAGERFSVVTAYDHTSAAIVERSGIPAILVGDSVGMVVHGHDSTLPVTIDDLVRHTRWVVDSCSTPLVIADLPFASTVTVEDTVRRAARLMAEGGAGSVKIEGGVAQAASISATVNQGIPVVGHVGLTPQSVHQIGLRVQGRGADAAERVIRDAIAVQDAGAWAVVLELVPAQLAAEITRRLTIPTIGIGAGGGTNAQIQVFHDLLGLLDWTPRHSRHYAELGSDAVRGLTAWRGDVATGQFPTAANSSSMDDADLRTAVARVDSAGTRRPTAADAHDMNEAGSQVHRRRG